MMPQRNGSGHFSLVAVGPLHRLTTWLQLSDEGLGLLGRRTAAAITLLWLPLLLLSLKDGKAYSGADVTFLHDIDTWLRYVAALPLMLLAERSVHRRMVEAMADFRDLGLVGVIDEERFAAILGSTRALAASPLAEAALLFFVYAFGVDAIWRQVSVLEQRTWYGVVQDGAFSPTLAGTWMQWVSVPLLQFLILRWYYRLLLWALLMWRVSRIRLRLQPLHPDRAGGIGFLAQLALAFVPLLVAQGTMASGWIAGQILYSGASLPEFRLDLVAATVLSVALVLVPLLAFMPALAEAKNQGLSDYGALAVRYASDFSRKWTDSGSGDGRSPLGDADFQSLADLGNSYSTMAGMRVVPFDLRTMVVLVAAFLLPSAPLVLTMLSADELLGRAMDLLL